jgi:FtsP/CotA-like multicopper oxidase with cupredoxin domain
MIRRQVTNPVTNQPIDYYEMDILPFQKEIFPGLSSTDMVGYDGMSPGPMFVIEKGREAVVRFSNKADDASVIHLHGSYSVGHTEAFALPSQANVPLEIPLGWLGQG